LCGPLCIKDTRKLNKKRWILIKKKIKIKKSHLCEFGSFASFWFWIEPLLDLIKKSRFLWRSSTKLSIFLGMGICLGTIFCLFPSFFNLNTKISSIIHNYIVLHHELNEEWLKSNCTIKEKNRIDEAQEKENFNPAYSKAFRMSILRAKLPPNVLLSRS